MDKKQARLDLNTSVIKYTEYSTRQKFEFVCSTIWNSTNEIFAEDKQFLWEHVKQVWLSVSMGVYQPVVDFSYEYFR